MIIGFNYNTVSAIQFDDNSGDNIAHNGSQMDSLTVGTWAGWFAVDNVNNTFRVFAVKGSSVGGDGKFIARKGSDGSVIRCLVGRAGANQEIESPTGTLSPGTHFIAWTFDEAGSPVLYHGDLNEPPTDVSTNVVNGDSAFNATDNTPLRVGSNGSGFAIPGSVSYMTVYNEILGLDEIVDIWRELRPIAPGCVLSVPYGLNGNGEQIDESGFGYHGIPTGVEVVPSSVLALNRQPGRKFWLHEAVIALNNARLADMGFARGKAQWGPGRLPVPDGTIG